MNSSEGFTISNIDGLADEYYEYIREQGEGVIKNAFSIWKWKSEDQTEYFYASGIALGSK